MVVAIEEWRRLPEAFQVGGGYHDDKGMETLCRSSSGWWARRVGVMKSFVCFPEAFRCGLLEEAMLCADEDAFQKLLIQGD